MSLVYAFDHPFGLPAGELRARLGGKAANLVVMATQLGLPVPPGFTITTEACRSYLATGWPVGLDAELRVGMRGVEGACGRRFGDPADPLLVSVRSGAPVSMPGMMDTILNLGLTEASCVGFAAASGDRAFADDCRRRLGEMYGQTVGVADVPDDPWLQLRAAVEAVFRSWNSDRARTYRAHEGIPDDLGTAVTIQAMVFGNRGPRSATGVLFTRNPATGEPGLYGDVMFDAQGEDVVAGTHRTEPLSALDERLPDVGAELRRHAAALERHYADLCDIEFTVEEGKLWLLQVRVGKRSPRAALRVAVDMAEAPDFPLTRREAVERVRRYLADPPTMSVDRPSGVEPLARGLAASPGVASGEIATSPEAAVAAADAGRAVILVRAETSPDDVHGMARAAGILTSTGGLVSHAAVVARGWGIPAVVGAASVEVHADGVVIGGRPMAPGEPITIDGGTGEVFAGVIAGGTVVVPEAATLLAWARQLGIEIDGQAPGGAVAQPEQGGERVAAASGPEAVDAAPGNGAQAAPGSEAIDAAAGGPARAASVAPADAHRALLVKGYATVDAVATALGCAPDVAGPLVDQLVADGLAESAVGSFRLTKAGKAAGEQLIAADRDAWGQATAAAALDAFLALDHRMKETVTAWQMRDVDGTQPLNDHSDAAYDAAVLDRLAALDADATAFLEPLMPGLPRLGVYVARLRSAMDAASAGDQRFVASPRVDSYHTVWFELHEDLILLAGRNRADEVAAGRA